MSSKSTNDLCNWVILVFLAFLHCGFNLWVKFYHHWCINNADKIHKRKCFSALGYFINKLCIFETEDVSGLFAWIQKNVFYCYIDNMSRINLAYISDRTMNAHIQNHATIEISIISSLVLTVHMILINKRDVLLDGSSTGEWYLLILIFGISKVICNM